MIHLYFSARKVPHFSSLETLTSRILIQHDSPILYSRISQASSGTSRWDVDKTRIAHRSEAIDVSAFARTVDDSREVPRLRSKTFTL